jgi:hypothetical protein
MRWNRKRRPTRQGNWPNAAAQARPHHLG